MTINKESRDTQIIKLSASSVKTYDQCPKKYFFNYIERAPRKQWPHFDLGNLCHRSLEFFHLENMKNPLPKKQWAKLMGNCFAKARQEFPNMDDSMLQEAKDLLTDYLISLKKTGLTNVKGVETSFNFHISENILIRGFLDRVDLMKDNRYHIVDYKTSKNDKYLDPFQLQIYGLWLKTEHPEVESFKGSYVLLRQKSRLKSYDFNMDDVERVRRELVQYAEKIRYDDVWTPIPTILCNWCDFQDICPAAKKDKLEEETW